MKINLIIIILFFSSLSFSQQDSTKFYFMDWYDYSDSTLTHYSEYDSINNYFNVYDLSSSGKILQEVRMDTNGYTLVDTSFIFHLNMEVMGYKKFENGRKQGSFKVFDTIGNKIYQGQYYKDIRVGNWIAYNISGAVTALTKYQYNLEDSLILDKFLISNANLNDKVVYDTINVFCSDFNGDWCMQISNSSFIIGKVKRKQKKQRRDYTHNLYYKDGYKE